MCGTLRRGGGGRRPLGRRRRQAPARPRSEQDIRDPRGAGRHRRHVGPVPLSRRALRQRHAHPGLRLQTLDRGQGPGRRPQHPELRAPDRGGGGRRPPHPLPPQGDPRRLVHRRRPLDGDLRPHRRRPARPVHLQLPPDVQRLLRLRQGLHAGLRGAWTASAAASCIRNSGRKISTTRASGWW